MKDNYTKGKNMKKLLTSSLVLSLFLTGCSVKNDADSKQILKQELNDKSDFIDELAIHDAVRAKDFSIVEELVKNGSKIDLRDKYGYTPLHLAVRLDEYKIAELLIKNGANVNNIDDFEDTPLLDSTRNSTNPMSKLLLCNGATKNVADRHDMTPLHNASKNGDSFIVKMIETTNISKMCEKLDITLDSYNETENKICGKVVSGVATEVNLTIVDEEAEEDTTIKAKGEIKDNQYCATLDKKLDSSIPHIITAIGTNSVDKDVETSNLNDLLKEKTQEAVEEKPAEMSDKTIFIAGLYEDLMAEFANDFDKWNAQLDKNGLVFRFKDPEVLFAKGSSDLKPNFEEILNNFFPRYLKVLDKYKNEIEKVRVEGHTSSEYRTAKSDEEKYAKNKALSTTRANKVLEQTKNQLSDKVNENKAWLDSVYEAEGMAHDNLIYNQDGSENSVLSRRVEFRINKIMNK